MSEIRKCYCVLRYLKQDRFTPFTGVPIKDLDIGYWICMRCKTTYTYITKKYANSLTN